MKSLEVLAWIFGVFSSVMVAIAAVSLLAHFVRCKKNPLYAAIASIDVSPSFKWIVISIICWCWILFGGN